MNRRLVHMAKWFWIESARNKLDTAMTVLLPLILMLFLKYGLEKNIGDLFGVFVSMTIMTGTLVSAVWDFGRYQKEGVFKKLLTTPLAPWELAATMFTGKMAKNVLTIIVVAAAAVLLEPSIRLNWLGIVLISVTGSIGMLGVSQLLLVVFRRPEAAVNGASILAMAMLALSGSWSGELLGGLTWVSWLLPAKYIVYGADFAAYRGTESALTFAGGNAVLIGLGLGLLLGCAKTVVQR